VLTCSALHSRVLTCSLCFAMTAAALLEHACMPLPATECASPARPAPCAPQGIAVFAYLSWVLHRVNRVMRAQVALKAERSTHTLLGVAAAVAAHVPLVLLALRAQDIGGNLLLRGSARPTQVRVQCSDRGKGGVLMLKLRPSGG